MNRSYRHVWNKAQGRFVVAAETASSRGQGAGRSRRTIATASALSVAVLGLAAMPEAHAQITVASGKTEVYRAPNGVQVVNIETANQAGLSHNKYLNYNVEQTGVVLNNGNSAQMVRQSQLAGQVAANLNLAAEAKVILNEVVGNSRSALNGFTEVLGGKADVVVANPYGITCTGCGFINTDRALLTTGLPQIGSGGTLDGFRVTQGDILINGTGIDASSTRLLDLVARSIKVDGRLVGADVGITTGANNFTWATRNATAIAGSGTTPLFAFDSTVLGGMYANRIAIVATEAGVGVRMLGEVAASGDDFSLDSAGKITMNASVTAARDLAIRQTTQTGSDAIALTGSGKALVAGRDVLVASAAGGITVTDALLSAGRDLEAEAQSISNTGTLQGASSLTLDAQGMLDNAQAGKVLTTGAGAAMDIHAGSLSNAGKVQSNGAMTVAVDSALTQTATGSFATASAADGGTAGALHADAATVVNQGTFSSAGLLHVGATTSLDNQSGGKLLGDSFDLTGGAITNRGGALMQWKKNGTVTVASLNNVASTSAITGSLEANNTGAYGSTYNVSGLLNNAGVIYSAGNATVTAGAVSNSNTAALSAMNDLTVTATQSTNAGQAVFRNEGLLLANRNMVLSATAGTLTNAGTTAELRANGNITATARDLVNQYLIAATNITLTGTNSVTNQPAGGIPSIYLDETPVSSTGEHQIDYQEYNCNIFGSACNDHTVYERTATLEQRLSSAMPATKAQILAVQTLTINWGAGGAVNQAGIMSANTINLSGSGTFTNQDFHLDRIEYGYRRTMVQVDCTFCSADYTNYYPANETQFDHTPGNDGDDVSWGAGGVWSGGPTTYRKEYSRVTYYTSGAGIFANTLNYSGGALRNYGSPKAVANASVPAPSVAPGLTLTVPTNPNGFFVPSKTPGAKYLVETNPLYAVGTDFVGSDYMANRLGLNPDKITQRLGDAGYEAQLVREQLIAQTGRTLLDQRQTEAQQVERLMNNGVAAAAALGLTYGQAPTAAQLANLTSDMVWMVETVVNGQKVLAPVVYLAQSTREAFEAGGTTIAATDATIKATTLENTGGTIAGTGKLNITTQGDITNTSGTIKGGDVSLTSTEGSIVNKTLAETRGNDLTAKTTIGKTAGIESTGSLAMDAKKDITVQGGNVSAGGDASLSAGGNVTFDTIVDKTTQSTSSNSGGFLSRSYSNETTTTEKNIGSNLSTGGNLKIKSGGDTTIAGSNASVGGNLEADTGGSFNVIARQDKTTTSSESSTTGLGVGGGLAGTTTTTTDTFDGKNKGSTLSVGGNAAIKAADTVTIQGSDVKVSGNADIDATKGIQVLDGLDEHRSSTRTETTTFMKIGGETAAEANAKAQNGSGRSAEAGASASANGSLKLMETTTTTTNSGSNSSVASNLSVGGNLNMKSEGTVTVQGSNVEAGGNLNVDAKKIDVLAGRNESWSDSKTESTSIGIYSDNSAEAGAKAKQVGASASASASASADSTTTIGVQTQSAESSDYSLKNTASSLKSGGNMNLNATEQAKFVGANVESGGDMSIKAKDISSMAAQDIEKSSSSSTTRTAGVYIGGSASADASASSNGTASASAGAEASVGLRYADQSESSNSGSVTQQTSSFKSGGNITREAQGTITDQGTQIEAAGNIKQSATTIKEVAAENSSYSSSSSSSNDARIGVYAGAEAGADSRTGKAGADASVGLKASYSGSTASESESSTSTVTSRYKAGGSIDSTSTDKTTLIGTQFEAGKDVNISAGSLDYQAAKDTTTSSSSSLSGSAEVKVGILGTAGVNGSAELDAEKSKASSTTSNAGGISAGGSINIKTKGDATFEGTNMSAKDSATVDAGGNATFNAARDTSSESSVGVSASLSAGTSGSGKSRESEGAGSLGVSASGASSDTAKASTIQAGNGGVTIKSGGNTTLEGTQVQSSGTSSVKAGGTVKAVDAKSSASSYGIDASIGGGAASGEGKTQGSGGFSLGAEGSSSSSSQGVKIQSGVPVKP